MMLFLPLQLLCILYAPSLQQRDPTGGDHPTRALRLYRSSATRSQAAEKISWVRFAFGSANYFGIWLDSRQRLVWGINDFDKARELPFTALLDGGEHQDGDGPGDWFPPISHRFTSK